MVSQYARYMNGAYPIPELMELKPREFMEWYRIMEYEIVEEHILNKHAKDNPGKPALSKRRLKFQVNEELKRRRENNG